MSVRLLPALCTDEDLDVWLWVSTRAFACGGAGLARGLTGMESDRRDADLMLKVMQGRCLHLIIGTDAGEDFFLWVFHAGDSLTRWRPIEHL